MNIGEEICGEWLRHKRNCDFVQYNIKTLDGQGEIDVVGINLTDKIVYTCEVAVHLITGLRYSKDKRPDNVNKLNNKFEKDIAYIRKSFPDYKHVFMLWSPIVKEAQKGSKFCQMTDVKSIAAHFKEKYNISIELVINKAFSDAINDLRVFAMERTEEMDSSVVRFLQVEEHLKKHLKKR